MQEQDTGMCYNQPTRSIVPTPDLRTVFSKLPAFPLVNCNEHVLLQLTVQLLFRETFLRILTPGREDLSPLQTRMSRLELWQDREDEIPSPVRFLLSMCLVLS